MKIGGVYVHGMSTILVIPILLMIAMSCTGNSVRMERLGLIDTLMESNPHAAKDSLLRMADIDKFSKREKMKFRMLYAKVQNKLYGDMPSDSAFNEVVEYYRTRGTSNEKMLALYLLGCIYRDQNEAPKAIQCYKEAAECTDTVDATCDFATLYRIYGQMADMYSNQYLDEEALEAYERYSYYAKKAGNLYEYIHGRELVALQYNEMGDSLKSLVAMKECISLYKKNGMPEDAAKAMQSIIHYYLFRKEYDTARSYMTVYEKEAPLPGECVESLACGYYSYYKAMYYEGIHDKDSAEYYYRVLAKNGYKYEGYNGLLAIYADRQDADSVRKYSMLQEKAFYNYVSNIRTGAVMQASAMYDYHRLQMNILEKENDAERQAWILALIAAIVVSACVCIYISYRRKMERLSAEKESRNLKIHELRQSLLCVLQKVSQVKTTSAVAIKEKDKEIDKQNVIISMYQSAEKDVRENEVLYDATLRRFKYIVNPCSDSNIPKDDDWKMLQDTLRHQLPELDSLMCRHRLSPHEIRVCLLVFMGFSSGEISILLDVSSQRVTNLKANINEKLFGEKNARKLFKNIQNAYSVKKM